jgi:hypothetical protein
MILFVYLFYALLPRTMRDSAKSRIVCVQSLHPTFQNSRISGKHKAGIGGDLWEDSPGSLGFAVQFCSQRDAAAIAPIQPNNCAW